MPRKVKTEKPPLQFLERSLCGARGQNAPEVRAAVNPKDFFTDRQEQDTTALKSWVSPQFQTSFAAAAPARRGRRRCQPATNILDSGSHLDRRNSVCKFPSLTFKSRVGDQPRRQPSAPTRKAAAQNSDTPQRRVTSARNGHAGRCSDGAASSSRCLIQPGAPSAPDKQSNSTSTTPASAEVSNFGPPPNVDTPDVTQEGSRCPSPNPLHMLLHRSCSPCNQPPDILVADTPERDYGLKVTWRRRKDLMTVMKARGYLSDADVLIHSSYSHLAT